MHIVFYITVWQHSAHWHPLSGSVAVVFIHDGSVKKLFFQKCLMQVISCIQMVLVLIWRRLFLCISMWWQMGQGPPEHSPLSVRISWVVHNKICLPALIQIPFRLCHWPACFVTPVLMFCTHQPEHIHSQVICCICICSMICF